MADDRDDEQELELTEELNPDDPQDDESGEDDGEPNPETNDEDEETVISFGEDDPDEDQPDDGGNSTIRKLRERNRELNRELTDLRKAATKPKIEVGEKPTMADCGYDEEVFERELDGWKQRKAEAEREQSQAEERDRAVQEAWQQDLSSYESKKARLGVTDFADAEEAIKSTLSLVQQAVIVKAANDPAAFIYALSKSDARLAEVAKVQDPVKLAAAIARMEGAIKVVKRRKGPAVDRPASGSGRIPGADETSKQLEKLEKEAERTFDRSKLIAFKKKHGL